MADLSQTAASVKLVVGQAVALGTAGETLTQGQPVYELAGKWMRCDANDGLAKANCSGIVLTPAVTNDRVVVAKANSEINLGATLVVGETYVVSTTVGAIAPIADLTTGHYVTILGTAKTAAILQFNPKPTGVQKA